MDSAVDPPSSLRQENIELIRNNCMADRLRYKDHFSFREVTKHKSSEESIFAKQ
jgi:hypothetical protein